jgi:Ca-activated chloride channel family protein
MMQDPQPFNQRAITEGALLPLDDSLVPIPLKQTAIRALLVGPLAAVEVEQRFHNSHSSPIEARYVFPLPDDAAILDCRLVLGERVIESTVQEREKAKQEYQEAASKGQTAGLLEQHRANIFSIQVANIQPDEELVVHLRFQAPLAFDQGSYSLALPTVVMPRYTPPDKVGDAPPSSPLMAEDREGHTLSIELEVDAGRLAAISSPSHPIDVAELGGGRARVTLQSQDTLPNKDFVLRYTPSKAGPSSAFFSYREANQPGSFLLTLTPQVDTPPEEIVPRDLIFVFDRSGSMGGTAIMQARNALRACLRALNEQDRFNILVFDHKVERFADGLQAFTQENIDRADAYIAGVEARGGTEILGAIKEALAQQHDPERLSLIVFLTDGGVGNEEEVLRELQASIGQNRIFAFGIGSAGNRYLLKKLAEIGRGNAEFLLPSEDIERAIEQFQRRISYPLITNLAIDWGGAQVVDVLPLTLPDLYAGQPLSVMGRYLSTGQYRLKLTGRTPRGPFEQTIEAEMPAETPDRNQLWQALPQLWARQRVEYLLDSQRRFAEHSSQVRDEVLSLGLKYRLLTPFTSFVAIETLRDEHGQRDKAQRVEVPIYLPEGTLREAFETAMPYAGSPMLHSLAAPAPAMLKRATARGRAKQTGGGFASLLKSFIGGQPEEQATHTGGFAGPIQEHSAPSPMPAAPVDASYQQPAAPTLSTSQRAEAGLRYLARTQQVNGSWNDDLIATSLALAAFVSGGHSDKQGAFRAQLSRTLRWLQAQNPSDLNAWVLAALGKLGDQSAQAGQPDGLLAQLQQSYALPAQAESAEFRDPGHVAALAVHSLSDASLAAALAQRSTDAQKGFDAQSGAVLVQGGTPASQVAATALGILLWNGFANLA